MKEFKILAVVVFFTLVTYYLVEPFAHSQMHKHIESEGFAYKDLPALEKQGDAARGQELVMGAGGCIGCHSMEVAGFPKPAIADLVSAAITSFGVIPPDLSNAGAVYDAKFLAALIKNPAHALMVEHKFDPEKGLSHPMPAYATYNDTGEIDINATNVDVADMVAYLQSVAVKKEELTSEQAYELACGRCHANHYAGWTQIGKTPTFKKEQDELKFKTQVLDYQDSLKAYMGKLPPDLSIYIRSRGAHYIETFVENPQNYLKGTAMPRVGVNEHAMEKVIEYLEDSGDAKRHERETVGMYVMIFIVIFALFALLWKKQIWRDLH